MSCSIEWQTKGIYRKFSGTVSAEEILRSNFDTHDDHRFMQAAYIINDFSAVTRLDISHEHTEIYASTDDIISNSKGKLKIALVVDQPQHLLLAQQYQQLMQHNRYFQCEIFSTLNEAQRWVA